MIGRPRGLSAALAVPLAALALSACGGDDSGDDPDPGTDFAAAAEAACAEASERAIDAYVGSLEGSAEESGDSYLEGLLEAREAELEQLRELEPPAGDAEAWDEYLELREQATAALADAGAEPGPVDGPRAEQLRVEADEIGAELGFEACANRLPDDDRGDIAETIDRSTSPEGADEVCRELATERFQSRFGGVEDCVEAQRRGGSVSAEVVDVRGVSGVSADATVELSDRGGDAPSTFDVDLLFEDGRWKLERIEPVG